jgi:hypothetical protein
MKADYKLGVCFDNKDPNNFGRIRAIPIDKLGKSVSLKEIQAYVKNQDNIAINESTYRPWYSTITRGFKEKDEYLCEPFLPKGVGVTPNNGQLVKIITYDDFNQKNEFIGPYTVDQITLTDEYRNVVNNLQKNIDLKEVLPKSGKTFISGYNGEQVILGDDEFLVRLGHINTNKTRNNSYPFIQLSQFKNSYNIKEVTKTITETPDIAIDYICQLYLFYREKTNLNDKNFTAELILFDSSKMRNTRNEVGLTLKTYSEQTPYINNSYTSYIVKHRIDTSNYNELIKTVEDILNGYKSNGLIKYFDVNNTLTQQVTENQNTIIVVNNNIPNTPNSGGAVGDSNIVSKMKNWIFRLDPNTNISNYNGTFTTPNLPPENIVYIRHKDYVNLDTFITKYKTEKRYGSLAQNNTKTTTITENVAESVKKPQSVYTVYSDKFLFLSSLKSLNIVDNFNFDGIPNNKLAEFLNGKNQNVVTYGFVRGEKLMQLLDEILEMFKQHGHEAGKDPRDSIVQNTKEAVENIKKKIKDELKESQNNVIINHNLRLN